MIPHQALCISGDCEDRRKELETTITSGGRRLQTLADFALPYRVILADPPWAYRDSTCRGAAKNHYPTMGVEELCALPVGALADSTGAHLWLWSTWPKLRDGWPQRVFEMWGFEWQGQITWDKEIIGLGRYLRNRSEVLLLGVKGKFPLMAKDQPDVVRVRRSRKHSEKPEQFRRIIERLSPGPRLELFARCTAPGWDRWGLEAPGEEGRTG